MAREGYVRQELVPLPNFSGNYPVIGCRLVGETPCGLSIRENGKPITGNRSRFTPHAILQAALSARASRFSDPLAPWAARSTARRGRLSGDTGHACRHAA